MFIRMLRTHEVSTTMR